MSLRDVVKEIADDMDGPSDLCPVSDKARLSVLQPYVKMLRMALKASEGESTKVIQAQAPPMDPLIAHRLAIEAAKERIRSDKNHIDAQEMIEGRQVELIGGPGYDPKLPTFMEISHQMPVGTKTQSGGSWYELRADGKLHHWEATTPARI